MKALHNYPISNYPVFQPNDFFGAANHASLHETSSTETLVDESIMNIRSLNKETKSDLSRSYVTEGGTSEPKLSASKPRCASSRHALTKSEKLRMSTKSAEAARKTSSNAVHLPHAPGTLPSYLRKTLLNGKNPSGSAAGSKVVCSLKETASRNIPSILTEPKQTPQTPPSQVDKSDEFIPDNQVAPASQKNNEVNDKLIKTVDKLRAELRRSEHLLQQKNEVIESLQADVKCHQKLVAKQAARSDDKAKLKKLELKTTTLGKINKDLQRSAAASDHSCREASSEVKLLKQELNMISKLNTSLTAEKSRLEQMLKATEEVHEDVARGLDIELQQRVKDLEIELEDREAEIDALKGEVASLAEENVSCKIIET